MTYENLFILSRVLLGVGALFLVISIVLFFKLNIPEVVGYLSGHTAQKAIRKIREDNEMVGSAIYKSSRLNEGGAPAAPKSVKLRREKNVVSYPADKIRTAELVADGKDKKEKVKKNSKPVKEQVVKQKTEKKVKNVAVAATAAVPVTTTVAPVTATVAPETAVLREEPAFGETELLVEAPSFGETEVLREEASFGETELLVEAPSFGETEVLREEPTVGETEVLNESVSVASETELLSEPVRYGETAVLDTVSEIGETEVLSNNNTIGETVVLSDLSYGSAFDYGDNMACSSPEFEIEVDITFMHSDVEIEY